MQKLQHLLNEVIKKTDALKTAQALYSRQLAPKFNTFDYINTNELGLSQILADLLNPKGRHGQEKEFLKLFIDHCLPNITENSKWLSFIEYLEQTKVVIEETTWASGTRRRMDIYLECEADGKSYGICIENKPYASDQYEQLKDYAKELDKRKLDHWHLIYLNEHSDTPSEHSIKTNELEVLIEEDKFSALKFSSLVNWLRACQVECQNHSVTEFLAQLIKFIQKHFMVIEDMNMENAVLEIMQGSEENIEASIQISNNVDAMKKKLIDKLKSDLHSKIKNYPQNLVLKNYDIGEKYEKFNFGSLEGIGFICFEFQNYYSKPYIGVRFFGKFKGSELATIHKDKINKILTENINNKPFKKSNWWPAEANFTPFGWNISSKPWLMIRDGSMATKILDEIVEIYEVLTKNGYEIL